MENKYVVKGLILGMIVNVIYVGLLVYAYIINDFTFIKLLLTILGMFVLFLLIPGLFDFFRNRTMEIYNVEYLKKNIKNVFVNILYIGLLFFMYWITFTMISVGFSSLLFLLMVLLSDSIVSLYYVVDSINDHQV